jgi:hypothetical protein
MPNGTAAIYREQAARLTALAAEVGDRTLREHFLHIAKSKQMLADLCAANQGFTERIRSAGTP